MLTIDSSKKEIPNNLPANRVTIPILEKQWVEIMEYYTFICIYGYDEAMRKLRERKNVLLFALERDKIKEVR